ncbi:MAG: Maf family protein [Candidatus Eremiobacteraeota bacterium]|nr:Maf family protein [Candidatus Eremiobacteraeota bacterium]
MIPLARVVLASASPRRLEILRSLGLEVDVQPSRYGEPADPAATPLDLAARHAREKARDVSRSFRSDIVVAADTVVDLDGLTLGKPREAAEAAAMLRMLSGRRHLVHTAYCIINGGDVAVEEACSTAVSFFALSEPEITEYVATGEPMDKAGAYGIQGRAAALVERIDGDFYTVMGFPLARFVRALRRLGFALPATKNVRHPTSCLEPQ